MSLVAYGSSDESSDEERNDCGAENENQDVPKITIRRTNDKLHLPKPKHDTLVEKANDNNVDTERGKEDDTSEKIHFYKLPKPKCLITEAEEIVEEGDIPPKKEIELKAERPVKKDRAPVKITVPSLSQFKDLEEENVKKAVRIKPSDKSTKLFALLPPPKGFDTKITKNLIPNTVDKHNVRSIRIKGKASNDADTKSSNLRKITNPVTRKGSIGISYDSNSEDEDDTVANSGDNGITDFFALTSTETVSALPDSLDTNIDLRTIASELKDVSKKTDSHNYLIRNTDTGETESVMKNTKTSLVSNVINLPKEEILLKNKAEVGPKLPIPEQEYNVDVEGNVAFDDKAIEYLCGRRGVKRKPKEVEEANIIEINGEDIKPDEREWLVKALTEEPVQRPISMQGGGVNSQSKKKHQITYLAHQAKAMEMELKNQWAQNRLTRKQTQSKYGF